MIAPSASGLTTYRLVWDRGLRGEARFGRHYNVPPLEVIAPPADVGEALLDAAYGLGERLLLSSDIGVVVGPSDDPSSIPVTVYAGVRLAATGRATPVAP